MQQTKMLVMKQTKMLEMVARLAVVACVLLLLKVGPAESVRQSSFIAFPPLPPPPARWATGTGLVLVSACADCAGFCAAARDTQQTALLAKGRARQVQAALLAEVRWRGCSAKGCAREATRSGGCPIGIERLPPTPYPAPKPPPVPNPLWAGDLRAKGIGLLPTPTPPGPPPPPLPPLPVVPLPDFKAMGVGQRFLPKIEMPHAEVNAEFHLDFFGNPVTATPPPTTTTTTTTTTIPECIRKVGFCEGEGDHYKETDCDGDGVVDHFCEMAVRQNGLVEAMLISTAKACLITPPILMKTCRMPTLDMPGMCFKASGTGGTLRGDIKDLGSCANEDPLPQLPPPPIGGPAPAPAAPKAIPAKKPPFLLLAKQVSTHLLGFGEEVDSEEDED